MTEAKEPRGILVVDDQDFFRESLSEALRSNLENVTVFSIPNGRRAAAMIAEEKIDLVVTDLQMPDFDGVSLLMELRKEGFGGPILVLSGHLSDELERVVMELGALAFVEKPVDLGAVVKLCGNALETSKPGIRGLSASGVAQLFALEGKTGALRVSTSENQGELFFREGRLVYALAEDLSGEEAAMEVLLWEGVELQILDVVPTFSNEIHRSLQELLLDSAREKDESEREINSLADGEEGTEEDGIAELETEELRGLDEEYDFRDAVSAVSAPVFKPEVHRSYVEDTLAELMRLKGAMNAGMIRLEDGIVLGTRAAALEGGVADGAGDVDPELVRSEVSAMKSLNPLKRVEDLSMTLGEQYHFLRALGPYGESDTALLLYLVLDQSLADPSLARQWFAVVAAKLAASTIESRAGEFLQNGSAA